jgi:hypothetical protein
MVLTGQLEPLDSEVSMDPVVQLALLVTLVALVLLEVAVKLAHLAGTLVVKAKQD